MIRAEALSRRIKTLIIESESNKRVCANIQKNDFEPNQSDAIKEIMERYSDIIGIVQ